MHQPPPPIPSQLVPSREPSACGQTENLDGVTTPWIWVDWYCVPQWSRQTTPPDSIAVRIFSVTMANFHNICQGAVSALAVVKRSKPGLRMREWEAGYLILSLAKMSDTFIDDNLDQARAAGDATRLTQLAEEVAQVNLQCSSAFFHSQQTIRHIIPTPGAQVDADLEYSIRAWCALERCFLPDAPHRDIRILKLVTLLKKLQAAGEAAVAREYGVTAGIPLAKMLNAVERLHGIIDLCMPSSLNRHYYNNAWAYNYLKKRVLTITNPNDFKVLRTHPPATTNHPPAREPE